MAWAEYADAGGAVEAFKHVGVFAQGVEQHLGMPGAIGDFASGRG